VNAYHLKDGQEYWATFAVYIPPEFPTNHDWATLFQRKFQDNGVPAGARWLSINVHGSRIDVRVPRASGPETDLPLADLTDVTGRWVQFVIYERLSSGSAGAAKIRIVGGSYNAFVQLANN